MIVFHLRNGTCISWQPEKEQNLGALISIMRSNGFLLFADWYVNAADVTAVIVDDAAVLQRLRP